jgi:hypothetical protein
MASSESKRLVVCISNEGFPAALEKRKIYVATDDPASEAHGLIRIIDESGDDYLYPSTLFHPISVPERLRKMLLAAA